MAADERKFLIFFMHGSRYSFDLAHVAEVAEPVKSWPIPLAPTYYSGAINFHGAIVAVMDLAFFLGFSPAPDFEKIIILDVNIASLGFLVERVARIVSEKDVELLDAPDASFALAELILPEGSATLLDVDAIIREAENTING
jgi:chemotaxis signal transduction protein